MFFSYFSVPCWSNPGHWSRRSKHTAKDSVPSWSGLVMFSLYVCFFEAHPSLEELSLRFLHPGILRTNVGDNQNPQIRSWGSSDGGASRGQLLKSNILILRNTYSQFYWAFLCSTTLQEAPDQLDHMPLMPGLETTAALENPDGKQGAIPMGSMDQVKETLQKFTESLHQKASNVVGWISALDGNTSERAIKSLVSIKLIKS